MKEKRKKHTIRDLIKKAEDKENELSYAIQKVEKNLVYQGFVDDVPRASMCCGGEFILEYKGYELMKEEIISLMNRNGCIKPQDFYLFIDNEN